MEGWIKLHRSLLETEILSGEVATKQQAWVNLLLWANHKSAKVGINQTVVDLVPGQLIGSIVKWGKYWKWSQSKVKRFLNLLKNGEMIEFKTERFYTVITICNYSKYQDLQKPDEEDSERETKKSRRRLEEESKTNKNEKNEKNEEYIFIKLGEYLRTTEKSLKEIYAQFGQELCKQEFPIIDNWIGDGVTVNARAYQKPGKDHNRMIRRWLSRASLSKPRTPFQKPEQVRPRLPEVKPLQRPPASGTFQQTLAKLGVELPLGMGKSLQKPAKAESLGAGSTQTIKQPEETSHGPLNKF